MGDKEAGGGCCECSCLEKLSDKINGGMGYAFEKLGRFIGKYPWVVMIGACVVAACFIPGMALFFEEENDVEDLWVPSDSQAVKDSKFVEEYFPTSSRFQSAIIVADGDNLLTPAGIQDLLALDDEVKAIVGTGDFSYDWESLCARLGPNCWSRSILEVWSFNSTVINALTQDQILEDVNTITVSPVYSSSYNPEDYLDVTKNESGYITAARAASFTWVLKQNTTLETTDDTIANDWELKYIDLMTDAGSSYSGISEIFFNAFRSYGDAASDNVSGDLVLLFIGYAVIIAFVMVVLGNFSLLYQRIYVALGGILCVGLAIVVSYGLCLYIGLLYGPVHSILPFLMIGVGVDDMFVIVQALDQLSEEERSLAIPDRIAATMKHAGVSITVTSITDIVAFGIGATTVLPALQSFCLYACIGILFIYLFQASFFVACIVYDEKRRDASRDACVCCYTHEDYEPSKCGKRNLTQQVFDDYYGPLVTKVPFKVVVLLATVGVLAAMAYGLSQLEQYFDPIWFLPPDSDSYQYFEASDTYFPSDGIGTAVYLAEIDYYNDKDNMETLYEEMSNQRFTYPGSVDSFHHSFWLWLNTTSISTTYAAQLDSSTNYPTSKANFYSLLTTFLASSGSRFNKDIVFDDTTGDIIASKITMNHINLDGSSEEIDAMDELRAVANSIGYAEDDCFAYCREYLNFETNKIIQVELFRNLGVAFLCVLIMTFILIASPIVCLFVSLCVILVLIDVAGTMYFWGLTIDTVTSVILIIAIGLAVDYSAHIGESFMMETGTRNERIKATMSAIGPAVFYGGFSTFLAFILLAASKSYIFNTFFKVFFCVVLYGLFHGLVFLPVVLSWIGPQPYLSVRMGGHGHGHGNGTAKESNGEAEKIAMENGERYGSGTRKTGDGVDNNGVVLEDEQHDKGEASPEEEENGGTITPVHA